jgi:dTDP-4-dehydrorhamnose 3,5-epimerase
MQCTPQAIADVLLIEPRIFHDDRGFFLETFQARKYAQAGIPAVMVQDNLSNSRRGVLRGLHYQVRQPQGKLVSVLAGEIFDVAVDLRRSSATFGKWVAATLSSKDRKQLWIPPGFAHGFLVLTDSAEVLYKVTDFWNPEGERTLAWDDPQVGIRWPLPDGLKPLLSPKDAKGVSLAAAELFN